MNIKKKFWKKQQEYPSNQYSDVRLYELVTVGILKLNQAKLETNFENITVILLKLFPDKFSLTYFPEFPDTIRVDNTLRLDCRHAGVVEGNRPKGFVLTGKGQVLAEKTLQTIESVSKMMGHKSIKTTQIYAKILNKKLSEDMQKIKDKFHLNHKNSSSNG